MIWNGIGGCLEINDITSATECRGNTWAAWNKTTPRHRKFIDKMLQSPCHIIATMRSKTETTQQEVNGRKTVVKLGMKSEQRDGIEYEFTIMLDIIHDGHWAVASKDRTDLFSQPEVITEKTGIKLHEWLENGIDAEAIERKRLEDEKKAAVHSICFSENADELKAAWMAMPLHLKRELEELKDFKKFDITLNGNRVFKSQETDEWQEFMTVPEPYASLINGIDSCQTLQELKNLNDANKGIMVHGVLNQYYVNKFVSLGGSSQPDGKLD